MGSQEHQEQLLPGIQDDITLDVITTKLSRRELHVLACVSRGWNHALSDHQIYNARVQSHLTESFIILEYYKDNSYSLRREWNYPWYTRPFNALVLCCLKDSSCFELPRIPHFDEGFQCCQCVTLDGKVYVLGGLVGHPSDQVYMLDLAGLRPWTQCASMLLPRCSFWSAASFGCAVMNGKIYVFGGENPCSDVLLCGAEVFDPEENRCSLITPMPVPQISPKVVVLGEEIVMYDGVVKEVSRDLCEIYHPVKDEWRRESNPFRKMVPVTQGKLWGIDKAGLHLLNADGNSCTTVYKNSFVAMYEAQGFRVEFKLVSAVVAADEILVMGFLVDHKGPMGESRNCILRSRGFGTKKEMEWREERGWLSKGIMRSMHLMHL